MKKPLRYSLLALALLATAGIAWKMVSLNGQKLLWGHLPLFLFVAAWSAIVLLFWNRYTRHPKGLRWLGLSTLSGLLLAVGFPPIPLTFLMFVGWVPLLLAEHEISQERDAPSKGMLFKYAYHTFVTWNILTTYWVANTAFAPSIVAIWLNSLFMIVPFLAFHHTKKILPRLGYASLFAYWISFEMLHLNWEMSWSWLNLGNSLARFPAWVQWYEYTGVFGGALWILLANVLAFKILKQAKTTRGIWQQHKSGLLKLTALVLLPTLVSLWMYARHTDKGREVEVVVVQPNFEPHYQKFDVPVYDQIERFLRLSAGAVTDKTEYLVWPETSFNAGNNRTFARHPVINEVQGFLSKYPNLKLVTGVDAFKIFEPGESHTRSTREQIQGADTFFWEGYNAAIQLTPNRDSIQFYIKSKLVPGAEIHPYHEALFFLKPIVDKLGGTMEGFGTQANRAAFSSPDGRVAPVICYESVFGEYHAGYVRQGGAEATFIMTNDGWWDNTAGHRQHLQFASLRSIETRRSTARSANTGISCFLNQRGDILQPTKYGVEAAIRGTIKFNDGLTFYVKWGDLIGRIAVFATAVFLLNTLVKGYLKKVKTAA